MPPTQAAPKATQQLEPQLEGACGPARESVLAEGAAVALHRGRWIEGALVNEQVVGVGGSIFSDELTVKVRIDLDAFNESLQNWTGDAIKAKVEQHRDSVAGTLKRAQIELDPELVIVALNVQAKTDALLKVAESQDEGFERVQKYARATSTPGLSEFIGISACAERALVAKHLFDRLNRPAIYMSGVAADYDSTGKVVNQVDHSFLVIPYEGKSIVFDVARKCSSGWPRLVVMDHELTLETFAFTKDLLIGGASPFSSGAGRMLFGVGNPNDTGEPKVLGRDKTGPY